MDIIGLPSTTVTVASKDIIFREKKQNKAYYAIQGHRGRYQSKDHMRFPISD